MRFRNAAARRSRRAALSALFALALTALLIPPAPAEPAPAPDRQAVMDEEWWLDALGVEQIWEKHTRGEGVVVAVIDTGVHPGGDLEGAVLEGFNIKGTGPGNVGDDKAFHGTTMATEIAGRGTGQGVMGVAPEAKILPVKLPDASQSSYTADALTKLTELDDPPEIVNMSYSGAGFCSPDEQQAVRAAVDKGMILVAAMGNDHNGQELPATPASCKGVISVGAFGWFGNKANGYPDMRLWQKSEQQDYTTIAAPGMKMIAFAPGSNDPVYFDGTSDAAAIASGSLALIRAKYPDMPSREVVGRALATAKQFGGPEGSHNEGWGYGAIRPRFAIEEDLPSDVENPVYDALDEAVPPTTAPETDETTDPEESTSPSDDDNNNSSDSDDESSASDSDDGNTGLVIGLVGVGAGAIVLLVLAGVLFARNRRST